MRPSLLIVDDHEDFRRSARTLLEAEGFTVVGEAGDGAEAIAKARDVGPDVLLVDIQLPDLDGFAVAEKIAAWPDPPVVVLISSRDATVYRSRLASTPARGFMPRASCPARPWRTSWPEVSMSRLGLLVLATTGALLGLIAERVAFGWDDPRHWVPDLAVGLVLRRLWPGGWVATAR
jgi:CheY-like chemotaxis protein